MLTEPTDQDVAREIVDRETRTTFERLDVLPNLKGGRGSFLD